MKKILNISLVILTAITTQGIRAQGEQYDMTEINDRLELATGKNLHLLDDANAYSRLQRDSDFAFVENECKNNWSGIIDNFVAIEGGDDARRLVVSAFQILDAGNYMSAIEKLVARFEAGTVGKPIMHEILNPAGRMQAFLPDNHTHARVIGVLNKIKAKVDGDVQLSEQIDQILSGESKLSFDKFRDAHQDTSEGDIPKILLAE
jgi:hypothetical protein